MGIADLLYYGGYYKNATKCDWNYFVVTWNVRTFAPGFRESQKQQL